MQHKQTHIMHTATIRWHRFVVGKIQANQLAAGKILSPLGGPGESRQAADADWLLLPEAGGLSAWRLADTGASTLRLSVVYLSS